MNFGSKKRGTTSVGAYPANEFGLHDLSGNVWEWVWDYWSEGWYDTAEAKKANFQVASWRTSCTGSRSSAASNSAAAPQCERWTLSHQHPGATPTTPGVGSPLRPILRSVPIRYGEICKYAFSPATCANRRGRRLRAAWWCAQRGADHHIVRP